MSTQKAEGPRGGGGGGGRDKTQPTPTELLAHWRVAVEANGVVLVAIESDGHLAGCEINEHDEQVIRTCTQHLLAFIGDPTLSAREDGWQLVPVVITPEMEDAADMRDDDEPLSDWGKSVDASRQAIWTAMLAAAPRRDE